MKRKQNSNYVIAQENGVFVARCSDLEIACHGATEQEADVYFVRLSDKLPHELQEKPLASLAAPLHQPPCEVF